ncbi:MAG: Coenzyme F420 hydrogenase/dehydrogenase, beta subunit C-terminal domain [Candidatus Thorarchaeota archaeon]
MNRLKDFWHKLARKKGWHSLQQHIWQSGHCYGCGACVIVCPMGCLEFKDPEGSTPALTGECKNYFSCEAVCPALHPRNQRLDLAEVWAAKALDRTLKGQDGSATTAILTVLLESGEIDAVIHTRLSEGYQPIAQLSREPWEVAQGSRSAYTFVSLASAIRTALIDEQLTVAVVGMPCVISGLANIRRYHPRIFRNRLKLAVSLFCTEIFQRKPFLEIGSRGKSQSISKIEIRRQATFFGDSTSWTLPTKTLRPAIRSGCRFCRDLISPDADLGMGAVDSAIDETTIVTFTAAGQAALRLAKDSLSLRRLEGPFPHITRLAKKKKKRKHPLG